MDQAARGLGDGAMATLARMLAAVEYEHDEDVRVFGFSRQAPPHYQALRDAAHTTIECYRRERAQSREPGDTGNWSIAFREFKGECTAVFINTACAGRLCCFSRRDGHFSARRNDVAQWPETEPTKTLLADLADNFGAEDEDAAPGQNTPG